MEALNRQRMAEYTRGQGYIPAQHVPPSQPQTALPFTRTDRVSARARELMVEQMGDRALRSENWKLEHVAIRDRCFLQAEQETPGATTVPVVEIDLPLAEARAKYRAAKEKAARAREAEARAIERDELHDQEMAQFADLDDRLASFEAAEIKAGRMSDLPYSLRNELNSRNRAAERSEGVKRARQKLTAERRQDEAEEQKARAAVRRAAIKELHQSVLLLAEELEQADLAAHRLRTRLNAFTHVLREPLPIQATMALTADRAPVLQDRDIEAALHERLNSLIDGDA
jgi:hypothetical protein